MLSFSSIRASGDLLFESIRGSHLYGLATEKSDIDTFGVWCCPIGWLLGSGKDYIPDVRSEKNDDTWYDIGKYIHLLEESNPDAIISLFTPSDKILHFDPVLQPIWDIRDQILSKACFKSFSGYAKDQLMKARGKNKKISINPEEVKTRKTPIDFCYVIRQDGGGTINLQDWLKEKGLKQEHCGLSHIQPGKGMYYLYYNWGEDKESTVENYMKVQYPKASSFSRGFYRKKLEGEKEKAGSMITFRGILKIGEESEQLRLTSIPKEVQAEGPLCIFQYNQDAFSAHCRKYKEYWEWVDKRNPERFVDDAEHGFNCYVDSETEFLTNNGWKKFDDITEDDLIGCWDSTNCFRFEKPISRIDKKYSGDIYKFESRYSKFSITANHNLYVRAYPLDGIVKDHSEYDLETYNWKFLPVKEYFEKRRSKYKFLGNLGNDLPDNPDFSDDFIKLLGYYISEGTIEYHYHPDGTKGNIKCIRYGQKEGRPLCAPLRDIATRIRLNEYSYIKRDSGSKIILWDWYPKEEDLNNILAAGYGSLNKRLPKYVFTFSKRQVDILIESLLDGDGHRHPKGYKIYYTFSKNLAEDLHTLVELNGYNAQVYQYKSISGGYERKDGKLNDGFQIMISKNTEQEHIMRKKNGMWSKEVVSDIRVVCFEMPFGTVITRNSNKIAFQGNSKNLSHCMRLMIQGMEIAQGKGLILDRRGIDADMLMDIKNHKMTYDEIMAICEAKQAEMEKAFSESTLRDLPPIDKLEEILVNIRRSHYGLQ